MNEKKVRSIITDPDHLPGWLSCPEGVFLREHAENATLSDVVEIGTFYGRSTSFILEGLRKRFGEKMFRVWTVDPWNWKDPDLTNVFGAVQTTFWTYMQLKDYLKNVQLLTTTSVFAAPTILLRKYEFAFIDGCHTEPHVMHDIILCSQVTKTIFVHDYNDTHPYVKKAVDYWVENTKWQKGKLVNRTIKLTGPYFLGSAKYDTGKIELK
jgi:hypothetical protein